MARFRMERFSWVVGPTSCRPSKILAGCRYGLAGAILLLCIGCAGYRVGNYSLYTPEIRTIYVPVFDSASFRRHLGEQLTEAVIKEIELRTPYKVVGRPPADSILTGRILEEGRNTIIPGRVGGPRESRVRLVVQVAWSDNRGNLLRETGPIPLPTGTETITETTDLFPEYGQSTATAYHEAIHRVAQQIVSMMEQPW